jgi:hypothetical protein
MNWKGWRRERSWFNLKYYRSIYLKWLTKTTKRLSQDIPFPSRARSRNSTHSVLFLVRSVALTPLPIKITALCDVKPCSLVRINQCWGRQILWRWRQQVTPKCWQISARLHDVKPNKSIIFLFYIISVSYKGALVYWNICRLKYFLIKFLEYVLNIFLYS